MTHTQFSKVRRSILARHWAGLLVLPVLAAWLTACSPVGLALQILPTSERTPDVVAAHVASPFTAPDAVTAIAVAQAAEAATEARVVVLPLSGPAANRHAEISGLAWFDEMLILLPQWPEFAADGSSLIFALPKSQIEARLDGRSSERLTPMTMTLDDAALRAALPSFGGYEAIAFVGDTVYLTIEAWAPQGSAGYLVRGWVDRDVATIRVDATNLAEIPMQTGKFNVSDESIVVTGDSLLTLYELNGAALNPAPLAHRFTFEGWPVEPVAFPSIEYRITDATPVDAEGRFWAINFFYPAEGLEAVDPEPLASQYGEGPTHARQVQVERLVEFAWDGVQVVRTERAPVQLRLALLARNWEGIARLDDRGLLIVTDKFPTTVLAFVATP